MHGCREMETKGIKVEDIRYWTATGLAIQCMSTTPPCNRI